VYVELLSSTETLWIQFYQNNKLNRRRNEKVPDEYVLRLYKFV